MVNMYSEFSLQAVGQRLEKLRGALGFDAQSGMAKFIGVPTNTYNNWVNSVSLIRPQDAIVLCAKTGVTLDWIYRGDPSGLPMKFATLSDDPPTTRRKA